MNIELKELSDLPTFHSISGYPGEAGVYFLFKDNKLIYIGQSKNISKRIEFHKSKKFDFLKAHIVKEYNKHFLEGLEKLYWSKYGKPHHKKNIRMTIGELQLEFFRVFKDIRMLPYYDYIMGDIPLKSIKKVSPIRSLI